MVILGQRKHYALPATALLRPLKQNSWWETMKLEIGGTR